MSKTIEKLEKAQLRKVPNFRSGDTVKVHFEVTEGTRKRVQIFEGLVIKRQGHGVRETFTVRKNSFGVGVERVFPVHSPKIEKVEIVAQGDVRRSRLYYIRERVGKRARVRARINERNEALVEETLVEETLEETDSQTAEAVQAEAVASEEAPQTESAEAVDAAESVEELSEEQSSDSADEQAASEEEAKVEDDSASEEESNEDGDTKEGA